MNGSMTHTLTHLIATVFAGQPLALVGSALKAKIKQGSFKAQTPLLGSLYLNQQHLQLGPPMRVC